MLRWRAGWRPLLQAGGCTSFGTLLWNLVLGRRLLTGRIACRFGVSVPPIWFYQLDPQCPCPCLALHLSCRHTGQPAGSAAVGAHHSTGGSLWVANRLGRPAGARPQLCAQHGGNAGRVQGGRCARVRAGRRGCCRQTVMRVECIASCGCGCRRLMMCAYSSIQNRQAIAALCSPVPVAHAHLS